jgi:hypothetical protein
MRLNGSPPYFIIAVDGCFFFRMLFPVSGIFRLEESEVHRKLVKHFCPVGKAGTISRLAALINARKIIVKSELYLSGD